MIDRSSKLNITFRFIYIVICSLFIIYALLFIRETSFIINGVRYYSLFDDGMISMKYAWNLAHGNGLVWNIGEHVEGYTNLLWVLIMSVPMLFLDKISSVLAVQVIAIPITIFSSFVLLKIARLFNLTSDFAKCLIVLGFFSYYPLIYWSLMGMEVSLVTLLLLLTVYFTLSNYKEPKINKLYYLGLLFTLLYLTRPDSLYFIAIFEVFLAVTQNIGLLKKPLAINIKSINLSFLTPLLIFIPVLIIHILLRYNYYQSLVPNTVLLKVTNFPIDLRIETGFRFVIGYLFESILLLLFALDSLYVRKRLIEKSLFLTIILATIFYQVYVGGDPWDYWRFFVPIFPLLLILSFEFISHIASSLKNSNQVHRNLVISSVFLLMFVCYNGRFFMELTLSQKPYQVTYNKDNVLYALSLNSFLSNSGKVGVFWAGTIPYYSDFYFIDFLGKMDKEIASMEVYVNEDGIPGKRTVPGHNKFDLIYSIMELQPDVAQNISWMDQNVAQEADFNYGPYLHNDLVFWIKNESENVDFSLLKYAQ